METEAEDLFVTERVLQLRPEQLPARTLEIEDPPRFRSLYRRSLQRALLAHAALEQLQREVRTTRARVALILNSLDADPALVNADVMGHLASIDRRIRRLDAIVKFARKRIGDESVPQAITAKGLTESHQRLSGMNVKQLKAVELELGQLAHDINNRLTVAMSVSQLLLVAKMDQAKLRDRLKMADMALETADGDVEQGLEKKGLNNQSVEQFTQILGQTLHQLGARLKARVQREVSQEQLMEVIRLSPSDAGRMLFALLEDASNAGATEVDIVLRVEGKKLKLEIQDNGPGFKGKSPLEASKLSKEKSDKNGNGLPFCFRTCQRAGGTIQLEDPHALGAKWLMSFPFARRR